MIIKPPHKPRGFRWINTLVFSTYGAVAQLGEHLHGMQGVRGSNPLSSTILPPRVAKGGTEVSDFGAASLMCFYDK